MTARILPLVFVAAASLLGQTAFAQQPEGGVDDPLPKDARVRYGISRPILRLSPGVGLIPPGYTNFLAPTMTGGIRRYDLSTGRPLDKKGIVTAGQVVVSSNGKRAAVARVGTIHVVNVATGKEILAVRPPPGVIIVGTPGVSLSGDGKILAFGGRGQENRGEVVVLDVDQNEVLAQCTTNQLAPVYVTLSRDGKTLASYGPPMPPPSFKAKPKAPVFADGLRIAQVWEVASGRELFKARVTGMGGNVVAAAFSPKTDFLAVSAGDGPIDLFDVKTGKRLHTLLGRKTQGVRVAISPDSKMIASIGIDYRIERFSADGKTIDITEPPPNLFVAPLTALEFADNQRVVAWQTAAQFAYAWDAPAARLLSPIMDHQTAIKSVAFPAGGKHLFSSSQEGRAFRWDFDSGALGEEMAFRPARIPGQPLLRPAVHLSLDGTHAIWPKAPLAEIFDVGTGDNLFVLPPPSSPPASVRVSVSPDGLKVAMLSSQAPGKRTGMCVVWDLLTRKRLAELETPSAAAGTTPGAIFSPDGTRVVIVTTADSPFGARLLTLVGYDLKTGKKLATVEDLNATGTVTLAVADDTTVILASTTGRMWSIDYVKGRVGEDFQTLAAKGEAPFHGPIAVSPDKTRFATGIVGEPFTTYGVRVFDLKTKKVLHTFIGHAGPVSAIHFCPDGSRLASGAQDTSVILWDLTRKDKAK